MYGLAARPHRVAGIDDLRTGVDVGMTQSRGNEKKHRGGGTKEGANDPAVNMEKIKARLKLLDFRLESLQMDLISLTVSRQRMALARSKYRNRLNLEPVDRKFGKKQKED